MRVLSVIALLCLLEQHDAVFPDAEIIRQYGESATHPEDRTLYGHSVPVLKMLKRLVRGFRRGYTPSITLVFYATQPVKVRWYRLADGTRFSNSAVRNMVPLRDGSKYGISSLKAGDVVATTLTLKQWRPGGKQDYETIITTEDATMQYQLSTKVLRSVPASGLLDIIDGPEWMAIPPPQVTFTPGQPLFVQCQVFVPNETLFTNELTMYRAVVMNDTGVISTATISFDTVIGIHKDTHDHLAEESPGANINRKTFTTGRRRELPNDHVIYQLKLQSMKATSNLTGVYQCALERQYDKLFVISTVTLAGKKSVFPDEQPLVDLIQCERKPENDVVRNLILEGGKDTCVRCRGIGYPDPIVSIINPQGKELRENKHITIDKYINVADAGVSEATYTFHDPNDKHTKPGDYKCMAKIGNKTATVTFKVLFRANPQRFRRRKKPHRLW